MKTKLSLFIICLFVIYLGFSFRAKRTQERVETLIADAYYGDLLAVKDDVEQGAPLDSMLYFEDTERDYNGVFFNALHAAASSGNEDIINYLLEQGMDINDPTPQGWTPLFIATRDGQAEAAKLLVFRKAELNMQTDRGATALMMALTQPYPTEKAREDLLIYLLKRGADPNLTDKAGYSPLFYAAAARNLRAVELLLEYGANLTTSEKKRILQLVNRRSDPESKKIAALLKKKAAQ